MVVLRLTGVAQLLSRLNKHKLGIEEAAERGMVKAGLFLQLQSELICPVQTGNLRASAFTRAHGSGFKTDVVVGYTATYAVFVHEVPNPPTTHGKDFNIKHAKEIMAAEGTKRGTAYGGMFPRGENQQWKFLEAPMRTYRKTLLKIIADEVGKVK